MLRMLSYNIEFGKNLHLIYEWILNRDFVPEILCFQEFPEDQLTFSPLKKSGFNLEFVPSFRMGTRTFGELTAYRGDLFKLDEVLTVELGNSLVESILFRVSARRTAAITTFSLGKKQFIVANIHLTWLAPHSRRRRQIEGVLKKMDSNVPALIVGDYNYTSLIYRNGLDAYLNTHGFSSAGEELTTHSFWMVSHQIDYVFHRNCDVSEVIVSDVAFSDHRPLIITFSP